MTMEGLKDVHGRLHSSEVKSRYNNIIIIASFITSLALFINSCSFFKGHVPGKMGNFAQ